MDLSQNGLNQRAYEWLNRLHFVIFSIGLSITICKLSYYLGNELAQFFNSSIRYFEWSKTVMEFEKPGELLSYILTSFFLFLYYVGGSKYQRISQDVYEPIFKNSVSPFLSNINFVLYYFILLSFNLLPLMDFSYIGLLIFLFVWITLFLFTIRLKVLMNLFPFHSKKLSELKMGGRNYTKLVSTINYFENSLIYRMVYGLAIILITIIFIQMWMVFLPYITAKPYIYNDFLNIPEQTIMDGNYVDNLNFINNHRLAGLLLYDPRITLPAHLLEPEKDYIPVKKSKIWADLLKEHQEFAYDEKYQGLFIDGVVSSDRINDLCKKIKTSECKKIQQLNLFNLNQATRQYTDFELLFLEKNKYELSNQLAIGHYFLHHSFFLNPISEFYLGKDPHKVVAQYGTLNAMLIATISKYLGGLSFSNYIKVSYLFYPLYYTFILLVSIIIFRNLWYVLLICLMCYSGLYLISFEAIYMAPGFNPIRHFFDIFVFLFLYFYLFAKRKKDLFFLLTVIFSVLTLLFDTVFGFFVIGGLIFALLVNFAKYKSLSITKIFSILICFCISLPFFVLLSPGKNYASAYYILGFLVPKANQTLILACLFLINIIYISLLFHGWKDDRWKVLLSYLFGFSQLSLIYYIWNPSANHLYSMIFSWAFLAGILFRELNNYLFSKGGKKIVCIITITFLFASWYLPAIKHYYQDWSINQKVFKDHKIYEWNFSRAQFFSTMDPKPFENAIQLINKYTKGNGIYIISRYDNLLPFLSSKYSLMPFHVLGLHLISEKEMNLVKDKILTNKPYYLFVDSNLLNNNRGEIARVIDPAISIHNLSRLRYLAFNTNLEALFNSVKENYVLKEKGQLINVYQLKK